MIERHPRPGLVPGGSQLPRTPRTNPYLPIKWMDGSVMRLAGVGAELEDASKIAHVLLYNLVSRWLRRSVTHCVCACSSSSTEPSSECPLDTERPCSLGTDGVLHAVIPNGQLADPCPTFTCELCVPQTPDLFPACQACFAIRAT
jgi:hypothetical protein